MKLIFLFFFLRFESSSMDKTLLVLCLLDIFNKILNFYFLKNNILKFFVRIIFQKVKVKYSTNNYFISQLFQFILFIFTYALKLSNCLILHHIFTIKIRLILYTER